MTRRFIITLLCCICTLNAFASKASYITLKSPDGKLVVKYEKFKYSITVDGVRMLDPSPVSMTLTDGTVYGGKAKLVRTVRKSSDRTLKAKMYKKAEVKDKYNELTLEYNSFKLVFRAYNEGVAYRFVSKSEKRIHVKSEQADFCFPGNWQAYVPYCNSDAATLEEQLCCSFENTYEHIALKDWDKGRAAFLPLVVEASNGYKIAITESDLFNFPGLDLSNTDGSTTLRGIHARCPAQEWQGGYNNLNGTVHGREDLIAKNVKAGTSFPWRIIQIARKDTELANSDMVWKLATPADPSKDWSWVKPGKAAWDWWNDWGLSGVDFTAGINTQTYKYFIDFAADNGIEYVILDEGWAVNKQADLMQVVKDIDMDEICTYAKHRHVGVILWAGYWAAKRDMEQEFLHYALMGVKGFKVDFLDRDDQAMVNFCTTCAQIAAKHKLMIDFHGVCKPAGLNRTFPNVVNFEGVHGLEQMKWEPGDRQVPYDVTIPYIRMVAGPMDYTQGAMRNANRDNYRPFYSEPMSQGTRCRQLAEYVVFDAPLTMLCDAPTNYQAEPECIGFISGIPTVWDETVPLDGRIAEFITMARRSGNNWYVASMTNWDERDVIIDLAFLPAGQYQVTIYKDGINADRAARDFAVENRTVSAGDRIKVHMAPGGGWAAKFIKK